MTNPSFIWLLLSLSPLALFPLGAIFGAALDLIDRHYVDL
jgi:hypothetical protein